MLLGKGFIRKFLNKKKQKLHPLSPTKKLNNIKEYDKWLTDIINNSEIGNIAITGDLGVGKSSIIRTYESNHRKKFVYISACDLSYVSNEKSGEHIEENEVSEEINEYLHNNDKIDNFYPKRLLTKKIRTTNIDSKSNEKIEEEIQQNIEKRLLIQLISICRKRDIPASRFQKVDENTSQLLLWLFPIWIALFILDILVIAFGEKITSFLLYPKYYNIISNICNKLLPLNIFLFIFFTVKAIIKHYNLPKINLKVSKGDNEMSLGLDTKDVIEPTSLDSNLNEIIYLMERLQRRHTGSFVLVIEDLDRYPADICMPILVKLNQINVMLNQRYRQKNRDKKKFKFMYVLRDDIFYEDSRKTILQKDPYKFFDIFLPIIPKLYFGNSANFFKSLFYDILIDEDFINLVAPFLYDYRKIYNVKNEFTIYYNSFEGKLANINNRNNTALLAFILYKVFFPAKYYELRYINEYGYHKSKLWDELHKKDSTHIKKDNFQLEDILKEYIQLDVLLIVMNVNLRYINLHGECLKESNFSGADLRGADLRGADLRGADLRGANLTEADLTEADLRGADLRGADLRGADLIGTNLTGSYFSGANLTGVNLTGANFSGADLRWANLTGADFSGADLRWANLIGANLTGADFSGADLRWENLIGANLTGADLTEADFSGANFSGANLTGANLTEANLTEANLTGADFSGANLTRANLTRTNLINTKFVNNLIQMELTFELKNVILLDSDLLQFDECVFNGTIIIRNPIVYEAEPDEKGNYIPYDMNKYKYNSKTNRMELKSNQSNEELLKK